MILSDDLNYSFLDEAIVRKEVEQLTNKGVDDGLIQYESTPLNRNKKKFFISRMERPDKRTFNVLRGLG